MPGLDGADEQDGAAVDKGRFDGLMSAYQKTLAENATLKAQLGQAGTQTGQPDSQKLEPGSMFEVDENGSLVEFEPPQPKVHNERKRDDRSTDDGSASYLQRQLENEGVITPHRTEWP